MVDGNKKRNLELSDVFYMLFKIDKSFFKCRKVLNSQILFFHTAVILKSLMVATSTTKSGFNPA